MSAAPVELPAGSAVITPNQMYAEIQAIGRKVDHLSDVVDPALTEIRRDLAGEHERGTLLDARVRVLENWRWMMLGAASALGGVAGAIVQRFNG